MSEAHEGAEPAAEGYKRPPVGSRFTKGRSGNPMGRPKARHRQLPYGTVLDQMVTIREDGRERRVTAAEAFLLQLTRKGLQGDSAAARSSLAAIETARESRGSESDGKVLRITIISYGIGCALRTLGMGVKRHPLDQDRVRWEIQPWIVEAALSRFAGRTLSEEQQREIWHAISKPNSVKWPDWWTYKG